MALNLNNNSKVIDLNMFPLLREGTLMLLLPLRIILILSQIQLAHHQLNNNLGVEDINSNNKMDTSWLGLPLEPFGFSRDAQPRLSKPRFAAVKFDVAPGVNVQSLHLQNSVSLLASK